MKIDHIFLDMDGVLADFVGGALRVHRRPDALDNYTPGEWCTHKVLGISEADFWHPIDHHQETFWAELSPYPWAHNLVRLCESVASVTLLSCPSPMPYSAAGKLQWIDRHFPRFATRYIFTGHKHLLASAGRLLIDDNETNCDAFSAAGGLAILFPQPWNRMHRVICPDRVAFVAALAEAMEGCFPQAPAEVLPAELDNMPKYGGSEI